MPSNDTPFHTVETQDIAIDESGLVTRRHSQWIDPKFLDNLKREREDSMNHREGEFQRVASVPVAVHEQWLREGFDMMKESPKEILKRLRAHDLTAFITTKKQV